MDSIKRIFIRSKNMFKFIKPISAFFIMHKAIVTIGIITIVYCGICLFYKCSKEYNVSHDIAILGDFLMGISMSVIAAIIFFIIQVYVPNWKKEAVLKRHAKNHIQNIIKEFNFLGKKLDCISDGSKTEEELYPGISNNCDKIKTATWDCVMRYQNILTAELVDDLITILDDDTFYMIDIKSKGILINHSIKCIIQDTFNYSMLWKKVDDIKVKVKAM